eukprot:gene13000-14998_t
MAAYNMIRMKILLHIFGKMANDKITVNVSEHDIIAIMSSNSLVLYIVAGSASVMANTTDPFAQTVHGTNPQYLIEKITRLKIYNCVYWKEQCFGLTAETIMDKAVALKYIGGTYGGNLKPTNFLCLVLKLLQLQPEVDIVIEYIKNEDFKYLRALGAFYLRLVGKVDMIYQYLEPLLNDYRKLSYRGMSGWQSMHIDEFIDNLLRDELVCDMALPHLVKRMKLEEQGLIEFRKSALDDEIAAAGEDSSDESQSESEEVQESAAPSAGKALLSVQGEEEEDDDWHPTGNATSASPSNDKEDKAEKSHHEDRRDDRNGGDRRDDKAREGDRRRNRSDSRDRGRSRRDDSRDRSHRDRRDRSRDRDDRREPRDSSRGDRSKRTRSPRRSRSPSSDHDCHHSRSRRHDRSSSRSRSPDRRDSRRRDGDRRRDRSGDRSGDRHSRRRSSSRSPDHRRQSSRRDRDDSRDRRDDRRRDGDRSSREDRRSRDDERDSKRSRRDDGRDETASSAKDATEDNLPSVP